MNVNTNTKVREWYNIKMRNQKVKEFKEKFTIFNEKEILETIHTCDFNTFRLICNAMDTYNYSHNVGNTIFNDLDYKKIKLIRLELNNRVNEILGEHKDLYNEIMLAQKHECWNGYERYKLFAYDLPPYADKKVIKTLVILVEDYLGKPLIVENIKRIDLLYNYGPSSELIPSLSYKECGDWETNEKSFLKMNNQRQKECETWYTFMKHIFNHDYDKANAIMKRYETNK